MKTICKLVFAYIVDMFLMILIQCNRHFVQIYNRKILLTLIAREFENHAHAQRERELENTK